jgi:FtsH-binding integral membrane protein
MQPGYELIREQLFIRKELKERVFWLVKIRWYVAGILAVAIPAIPLLHLDVAVSPLAVLSLIVLAYNGAFLVFSKQLERRRDPAVTPFLVFAHVQIGFDLTTLFVLIALTGGTSSPFLILVICHIVLAGILLPPAATFLYAGITLAVMGLLAILPRLTNWGAWQPILFPNGRQGNCSRFPKNSKRPTRNCWPCMK